MSASKEPLAPPPLTPLGHAIAGAGGAVIALILVYPLDVLKTRLQADPLSPTPPSSTSNSTPTASTSHTPPSPPPPSQLSLRTVLHSTGLFSGLPSALLNTLAANFAYFYAYDFIRTRSCLGVRYRRNKGVAGDLLRGAAAGAVTQLIVTPLSVASTRKQVDPHTYGRTPLFRLMYTIYTHEGLAALYAGLTASLILVVNPSITYGFFETLKRRVMRGGEQRAATPGEVFVMGAVAKTLATVVTYPLIMAKVAMQYRGKDVGGMAGVLGRVWRERGWRGWYKGMQSQIYKAVLAQALLFLMKDQLEKGVSWLFMYIAMRRRVAIR